VYLMQIKVQRTIDQERTISRHLQATPSMSQLGHFRPKWLARVMSAFPPIATIQRTSEEVRFVPTADIAPVVGNNGRSHQLRQLQVKHPGFWMTSYFEMKEAANRGGLRQLGRELRRVRNDLRYDRPASFAFKIMNFIIINFQSAVVDVRLDRSKRYFSITNGTLASVLHILKCHMLSLRQTWFGARATESRMSSGLKLNWRAGRFELALRSNQ
jgi:hypothetical protein